MAGTSLGFLSIEDLVPHQGELAITLALDEDTQQASVEAFLLLVADTTQEDIAAAYISLLFVTRPHQTLNHYSLYQHIGQTMPQQPYHFAHHMWPLKVQNHPPKYLQERNTIL